MAKTFWRQDTIPIAEGLIIEINLSATVFRITLRNEKTNDYRIIEFDESQQADLLAFMQGKVTKKDIEDERQLGFKSV